MIVGHRGAGKPLPPNTLESLKQAVALGLHAVEFDVQKTKDHKFVLSHDARVKLPDGMVVIAEHTQAQLKSKGFATIEEALRVLKPIIAMVDIKSPDSAPYISKLIGRRNQVVRCTSPYFEEIASCKNTLPKHFVYVHENKNPFRAVRRADRVNAEGVSLKWFLINPITYRQAKRRGLEIMLYTVNSRAIGRLVGTLYPAVSICTDRPKRFIGKRYNW